ncbi:DUF892 family protein [Gramella sp. AN32]|uniref:DUF892 family protein n=1 Tax=Christiangramia antarctica TaxID=2058158 RepID=A0ABW5WZS3_9FLAO|nr:DUF892 family protein [Gramella sp. AN32]MCM4155673.1 ferritin-like domain-containing protein [Gramella sp. AN32]
MKNLNDLLASEIKDIYAAEKLLLEAIPTIQEAATHKKLKKQLANLLNKTEKQYSRIQKICTTLEINPGSTKCKPIEEMLNECNAVLDSNSSEEIRDTLIVSYARKIEHYLISVYETSYRYAKELKLKKIKKKLKKSRDEKILSEQKFLKIFKKKLLAKANTSK